jgi:hypothetical protein
MCGGCPINLVQALLPHIMLRGHVNPKVLALLKKVTDFGYPRACRFRKHQIENKLWLLPLPNFFKMAKIGKNFGYFHVFLSRGTR